MAALHAALRLRPEHPDMLFHLASTHLELLGPDQMGAAFALGRALMTLDDPEAAERTFRLTVPTLCVHLAAIATGHRLAGVPVDLKHPRVALVLDGPLGLRSRAVLLIGSGAPNWWCCATRMSPAIPTAASR
ncbi:hypothetical protein [Azospirillum aestuarii]|uniref:hypothetical protein n=1 Tax=Azospirillum aestuarii TaxID=2802052 RepID=UPI004054C15C